MITKLIKIQLSCTFFVLLLFSHSFAQNDAMFIDTKGNVGIGTATPTKKLEIQGKIGIFEGRNTDPTIRALGTSKWMRIGGNGGGLALWGNNNVETDDVPAIHIDINHNVGIGTTLASTQLEVKGNPTDKSIADGIIAPRISRSNLIDKSSAYKSNHKGAIIYVTDLTGTTNSTTADIGIVGYYYFDGSTWRSMNSTSYGDIKMGVQPSDHNGWIKLNGRSVNSLTTTQKNRANDLGFYRDLPNADGRIMTQGKTPLGGVSDATPLDKNQLPDVKLSYSRITNISTSSPDPKTNSVSVPEAGWSSAVQIGWTGNGSFQLLSSTVNTTSINGGVSQEKLTTNNLPQLNVNTFIYLGQ